VPSWDSLSFIDHYLEHNKKYESPTSFWKWSSYAAIAAVLRDSVYRRMGDSRLYPNIYVLSLAESSFHRKGRPVEFAEDLVREVANTKVISGRASVQAIVQELSRTESDRKTGKIIKGGSAIFFAPEMAAGLVSDPAAIGILTDIYEPRKHYDSLLKTQAKASISNLVFSMYAASNEELLKSVYDTSALRGGLLARTFLVVPDEFRSPNSLVDITPEEQEAISQSKKCLLGKLKKISELAGETFFADSAQKEYKRWYEPFRKSHSTTKDRSGMLGRIHTGILKLSILFAANDYSVIIEGRHIDKAIDECMALVPNYNKLSLHSGNSSIKDAGTLVLNDLIEADGHCLTRRQLFQKHLLEFDPTVFDTLMVTLSTAGLVEESIGNAGSIYRLTAKAVEILKG
jgi:hypothetical protein